MVALAQKLKDHAKLDLATSRAARIGGVERILE
jgi:hypothetical protein